MKKYIYLGPVPSEEKCEQFRQACDFDRLHAECSAFKAQMIRHHPVDEALQPFCGYSIKGIPHDFGNYYQVCAWYDSASQTAAEWAYTAEVRACTEEFGRVWDEQARAQLGLETTA